MFRMNYVLRAATKDLVKPVREYGQRQLIASLGASRLGILFAFEKI
jgi:hypothetical protein